MASRSPKPVPAAFKAGDLLISSGNGPRWRVVHAVPGRLRLVVEPGVVSSELLSNLVHLARHRRWLQAVRVNRWAGSAVIAYAPGRRLRRSAVVQLLEAALQAPHPGLPTSPRPALQRAALGRLGVVGGLLGLKLVLGLPAVAISAGLLPLLLGPLLLASWAHLRRGLVPPQSLDLLWFGSLLWRGEVQAALLEYSLLCSSQLMTSWSRSPRFSRELQQQLDQHLQQITLPSRLPCGQWQPQPIAQMQQGALVAVAEGSVVPAAALVVAGRAWVSCRARDGDPGLVLVQAFQRLPAGIVVHSGAVVIRLTVDVVQDRDLRGLRSLVQRRGEQAPLDRPPRLVAKAQQWHKESIPWLLLAGGGVMALGRPHAAAGLMQFDPGNDWQHCAAIVYGAAQRAAETSGIALRRPEVIDALAQCRQLVISDAVLGSWSTRQLEALHHCDPWTSRERVIEILAGFRVLVRPDGLAPLRNLLLETDLEPAVVDDLEPLPPLGYRGRVDGVTYSIGGLPLLRHLKLRPPEGLPAALDRVFLLRGRQVLAAADFELHLPRRFVRLFKRLCTLHCQIHLLSGWDTGLAPAACRRLGLPAKAVLVANSMLQRVDLVQQLRQSSAAPVAYLGYAYSDAAALAAADVAIALNDGTVPFTSLLADLVVPAEQLDRLTDCMALAQRARRLNRSNMALVAGPHVLALALNLLHPLHPLASILLTDLPLLVAQLQTLMLLNPNGIPARTDVHARHRPTSGSSTATAGFCA